MIFNPKELTHKTGFYRIPTDAVASAHKSLESDIIKDFWHSFSFTTSRLTVGPTDGFSFTVGEPSALPLCGYDFTINITERGISLSASSEKNLKLGLMTLLDRIKISETEDGEGFAKIDCAEIMDKPDVGTRMVHFCVFHETELWELEHFLRFAAALRFTHVIVEFWGMLRYDCMRELSWQNAYTKEQIRPIFNKARDLGLEIIPMFNHWGHAASARMRLGKHVVLDQNPALWTYFSEDGWCWDIRKEKVRKLLASVRDELIELSGEGEYFHVGCDEAYNFSFTKENMDSITDYINGLCNDLSAKGRRIIIWGDMFLAKNNDYNPSNRYECNNPSPEYSDYMLRRLDRRIVVADWQYNTVEAPIETSRVFRDAGIDCLVCPWDSSRAHVEASVNTVKSEGLMGYIHTTWHTLSKGMSMVTAAAVAGIEDLSANKSSLYALTPALWRKVMPASGSYEKAGWSKYEVAYIFN